MDDKIFALEQHGLSCLKLTPNVSKEEILQIKCGDVQVLVLTLTLILTLILILSLTLNLTLTWTQNSTASIPSRQNLCSRPPKQPHDVMVNGNFEVANKILK